MPRERPVTLTMTSGVLLTMRRRRVLTDADTGKEFDPGIGPAAGAWGAANRGPDAVAETDAPWSAGSRVSLPVTSLGSRQT